MHVYLPALRAFIIKNIPVTESPALFQLSKTALK